MRLFPVLRVFTWNEPEMNHDFWLVRWGDSVRFASFLCSVAFLQIWSQESHIADFLRQPFAHQTKMREDSEFKSETRLFA
ncbi:hypothetical protein RBSH_05519 [Rhodopirellula baltica SH28]|uniref:Uncharacterized protein n=2 Tax=Rhodopirellula baltica TaxID=265606 RepID=K5CYJ5_RHOBT|nr:hypothetical protein RBSH_05519 [Rhodopirellula baltica SH28]